MLGQSLPTVQQHAHEMQQRIRDFEKILLGIGARDVVRTEDVHALRPAIGLHLTLCDTGIASMN